MRRQVLSDSNLGLLMVVLLAMQLITSCLADLAYVARKGCEIPNCKKKFKENGVMQKWRLLCSQGHYLKPEQYRYGKSRPTAFQATCETCQVTGTTDSMPWGLETLALCKNHLRIAGAAEVE
ncbi:hypothetical protein O181_046289 [Austropuccinia psidii MF-1]|uniref:Uncharacterized protein n=1 Tax=Austropuccinia psidii MF-1 TaxID=1389203 RepID=A0A9Q3HL40_9BASI|nr:hypothetical protein [Austropuccinia psidii MF-1]